MLKLILACLCSFSISSAALAAPTGPSKFYKDTSTTLTRSILSEGSAKRNCDKLLPASRAQECRNFADKYIITLVAELNALDRWQKDVQAGKDSQTLWAGKVNYIRTTAKQREMIAESWKQHFFTAVKWYEARMQRGGVKLWRGLQQDAQVKRGVCKVFTGERAQDCTQAYNELIAGFQKVIDDGERMNPALKNRKKKEYFDAYVQQGNDIADLIALQAKISQHYLP